MFFPENEIKIRFKNTGNPIPEADLPHLFVPFYRSDSTKKIKGHGIGLPLTKKIIELHNGNIKVSSSEQDGTQFTMIIKRK
jgi:two-component system, OmpR family, sensor histidine kinase ArlS